MFRCRRWFIVLSLLALAVVVLALASRQAARRAQLNAALVKAVHAGDVAAAERALHRGADANMREEAWGPFWTGLEPPSSPALRQRFERLWNKIRAPRYHQDRPVLLTAALWKDAAMIQTLLARGADANALGPGAETALMLAVSGPGKDTAALRLLLETGARVNARDREGNTALKWAKGLGFADAVPLLKQAGGRE